MIESTTNKVIYTVTQRENPGVFSFPIKFFEADNIVVCIAGTGSSSVKLNRGVEFDVESKASYESGASITLHFGTGILPDLAQMIGKSFSITRELPVVQQLSLPNHGILPSEEMEKDLDKIICIIQQQDEELDRCIKVPITGGTTGEQIYIDIMSARDTAVSASVNAAGSSQSASASASESAASAEEAAGYAEEAKHVSGITEHDQNVNSHANGFNHNVSVTGTVTSSSVVAERGVFSEYAIATGASPKIYIHKTTPASNDFYGEILFTDQNNFQVSQFLSYYNSSSLTNQAVVRAIEPGNPSSYSTIYVNAGTANRNITADVPFFMCSFLNCNFSGCTSTDCYANTQASSDNSTKIATTAFVKSNIPTVPVVESGAGYIIIGDTIIQYGYGTEGSTTFPRSFANTDYKFLLFWETGSHGEFPGMGDLEKYTTYITHHAFVGYQWIAIGKVN